jgi:hypothetical protein
MVRFAPDEVGTWSAVVKLRDREGTAEIKPRQFTVIPGEQHGFVRMAANKRYLQFDDGTPYYGVGLWYNDGYERFDDGQITEEALDGLVKEGANFISFFHSPLETMGTGLGRYDENRAGRLDQIFEWCEKRDLKISWNIWFHSYISEAVWGGGNARYRSNPYRSIAPAEEFFASEQAWEYEKKLHRYMVARWGYSRALALWFVIDEINGTEGWTKGGAEAAEGWCRRMHAWLKENDPYHRLTTGTQSGGIQQWWPNGYQIFDVAAREIYELQGHPVPKGAKPNLVEENPLRYSYLNYARQTQALRSGFEKPSIIGECGWDHTYYEPAMPGYLEMYHNALWSGLTNGLAMTPFWWAYGSYLNSAVVAPSMSYFSRFVRGIDFSGTEWAPAELTVSNADGWGMRSPRMTFGWVVNPLTGVAGETVRIGGIEDGEYDVYFYRTWRGMYIEPLKATASGGSIEFKVPELTPRGGRAQNIGNDVAFKLVRQGVGLKAE